jgi:hypothetical protein
LASIFGGLNEHRFSEFTQPETRAVRRTNGHHRHCCVRPVSLSRFRDAGALADNDTGRKMLYAFGGHSANFRKKGGFPTYTDNGYASPTVKQKMQTVQQFLLKYGEFLVEDELLTH